MIDNLRLTCQELHTYSIIPPLLYVFVVAGGFCWLYLDCYARYVGAINFGQKFIYDNVFTVGKGCFYVVLLVWICCWWFFGTMWPYMYSGRSLLLDRVDNTLCISIRKCARYIVVVGFLDSVSESTYANKLSRCTWLESRLEILSRGGGMGVYHKPLAWFGNGFVVRHDINNLSTTYSRKFGIFLCFWRWFCLSPLVEKV